MQPINRRHFIAAVSAAALSGKASFALKSSSGPTLAFTASKQKLAVYAINNTRWTQLQSLDSEAPTALAVDSRTRTLYVLHAVDEYRNLPRGYIESFHITQHGHLEPLSQQALSLSATQPRHIAIAPNGKTIAVSIPGGSAYNLLPIQDDGRLAPPTAIRKETSLNATQRAIPGPLTFNHTSDRIFALDQGHRTLSVFTAQPALPLLSRIAFPDDFNPSTLKAHEGTDLLTVTSETGSSLGFRYNADSLFVAPENDLKDLSKQLTIDSAALTPHAASAEAIAFLYPKS